MTSPIRVWRRDHQTVLVSALASALASSEDPRKPHPRMTTPNPAATSSPTKTGQTSSLFLIGAGMGMRLLPSPSLTDRDLAILERLTESEPLTTSELRLLFFDGLRTCQARLKLLDDAELLCRVYPARSSRGGKSEPLWFLTPHGRGMISASSRRPPGLSIPDLEHRRAVARFFLALVERSLNRKGEGLYTWFGETNAAAGVGSGPLRPDGYGRYLLPDGEVTFYLELDRGTEPARRVAAKLTAYRHALANDPEREYANVLLVCHSKRRLANLAGYAPEGPPWTWGTVDGETYELLPDREQERPFDSLPRRARDPSRHIDNSLGREWRHASRRAA
jgi:Replication-relaxation